MTTIVSDNDYDVIIEEIDGPEAGWNLAKAKWAFTLWQPHTAAVKQKPVWWWGVDIAHEYQIFPYLTDSNPVLSENIGAQIAHLTVPSTKTRC